jgi:hypothetical protein
MKIRLVMFIVLLLCAIVKVSAQTAKDSFYVFVGEKIDVKEFEIKDDIDSTSIPGAKIKLDVIHFDQGFKATYRIIENVFNHYKKDTIEFEAYDHYGIPAFSKFKDVLLFVFKKDVKMYHVKYLYSDVYLAKDGRWACPGHPIKLDKALRKPFKTKPIQFLHPVTFDLTGMKAERIKFLYPEPYYKIENNKATALMGVYVDELLPIKKEDFLDRDEILK